MRRFLSTMAVVAFACAGATIAFALPSEPARPTRVPRVSAPEAPLTLACGGELQRTVETGVDVENVTESVKERTWLVAVPASGKPPDVEIVGREALPQVDGTGFLFSEGGLSGVLRSEAVDSDSLELAGASVHTAVAGDLRGVAANPCLSASPDQWLIGSRARVGTSNQLILTNPGPNPVTAKVEALAGSGKVPLGGTGTVVVDGGQTRRVLLDGALADQDRFALHVTTGSGEVAASLQQTGLDGYTPTGVSFVTPAATGRELTIPGVRIDDGNGTATLRIANPNPRPVTVDITTLSDASAGDLPGGTDVTVEARSVLDLSLAGLPAGSVSLRVKASGEVVAGAESVARSADPADNAWAAARSAASSGSAVFGPVTAELAVVTEAGQRTSVTATPIDGDGKRMPEVKTEMTGHATIPLPEGAVAVRYESSLPVHAAAATSARVNDGKAIDWVPLGMSTVEDSSRRVAVR